MELSDIRKVASLARLALDDEELVASGKQLTSILEYVRLLDEVDITGVAPMTHPVPAENVFREDQMLASLPREAALSNAPRTDGEFFVVPKILEEKGA